MVPAMTTEMRKTGIDVVGDMPWGAHFCLFYETQADLLETLVSYCKAGLESQEFCLWVVAEPLTEDDARRALKLAIPGFDQYVADQSIEIVPARDSPKQSLSGAPSRVGNQQRLFPVIATTHILC